MSQQPTIIKITQAGGAGQPPAQIQFQLPEGSTSIATISSRSAGIAYSTEKPSALILLTALSIWQTEDLYSFTGLPALVSGREYCLLNASNAPVLFRMSDNSLPQSASFMSPAQQTIQPGQSFNFSFNPNASASTLIALKPGTCSEAPPPAHDKSRVMLIIIISLVILSLLAAIGGFLFYRRQQMTK